MWNCTWQGRNISGSNLRGRKKPKAKGKCICWTIGILLCAGNEGPLNAAIFFQDLPVMVNKIVHLKVRFRQGAEICAPKYFPLPWETAFVSFSHLLQTGILWTSSTRWEENTRSFRYHSSCVVSLRDSCFTVFFRVLNLVYLNKTVIVPLLRGGINS